MTPKEVRDWIRSQARPCPCCGAAVLIRADTDARGSELWRAMANHQPLVLDLVSAEDAERSILEEGFSQSGQSVGGRVREPES